MTSDVEATASAEVLGKSLQRYLQRALGVPQPGFPLASPGTPASLREVAELRESLVQTSAAYMFPHLSSGGYKVPIEVGELAAESMSQMLGPLAHGGEFGILSAHVASIVGKGWIGNERQDSARNAAFVGGPSHWYDDSDVAGPARALGMTPSQVMNSAVESTGEALLRLVQAEVLRKVPTLGNEQIFELVHDGFGPASQQWSDRLMAGPTKWTSAVSQIAGSDVIWEQDLSGDLGPIVEYVRWVGAWMGAAEPSHGYHHRGSTVPTLRLAGLCLRPHQFRQCRFRGLRSSSVLFNDCHLVNCSISWTDTVRFEMKGKDPNQTVRSADMMEFRSINHDDTRPKGASTQIRRSQRHPP